MHRHEPKTGHSASTAKNSVEDQKKHYICADKLQSAVKTLLEKIRLSKRFGKTTYVISAILTAAMSLLVVSKPLSVDICVIIKLISIPIIWYLRANLSRGLEMYFYLNLGISRKEYWIIPFAVEFVAFTVLMVISSIIGFAIR